MNKLEITRLVAEQTDVTKKVAEEVIDALFDVVQNALKQGDKAVFTGFGTFEVHQRSERTGRNPQTGEEIIINGGKAPVFKAAKNFKDFVNE